MLCGNNGEACWAKYGSYPLHKAYCHEQALRILLASIESHANRYRRHIVPVCPCACMAHFTALLHCLLCLSWLRPATPQLQRSLCMQGWRSSGCKQLRGTIDPTGSGGYACDQTLGSGLCTDCMDHLAGRGAAPCMAACVQAGCRLLTNPPRFSEHVTMSAPEAPVHAA